MDTFRRVYKRLDMVRFNAYFIAWMQKVLSPGTAGHVCIDGKTLCVVSTVASASSLAQVTWQSKGQELGAVPELLALLDLHGALVSLDALSCQPEVVQ